MIVISNPTAVEHETYIIHSLFGEGLELFHVRKPEFTVLQMKEFLSQINSEFRPRLVLHQHHQLADGFGINRIHFSRNDRNNAAIDWNCDKIKSTSVHCINFFNELSAKSDHVFDYAFLSPVYPSISKPGHVSKNNLLETIKNRNNFTTRLIALGGISPDNVREALETGFDDVALLGTIWNSNNPIDNFRKCQEIVLSYSV